MIKKIILIVSILILGIIFYNYFYVNNYNFKLNGNDTITLNIGDTWEDPLYTVDNNKDVNITNNINYNEIGNYKVKYSLRIGLFRKSLTRNINIVNKNEKSDLLLSLKGDNPYYLMINNTYEEDGYEVYDLIDGLVTDKVIVTNNIDNSKEGNYLVNYKIKNSNGITKNITRDIIVYSLEFEGKLKTYEYTQNNEILLNITDNNYSYTILPDNTKSTNRNINYVVDENNTYTFKIYDVNNKVLNYDINVSNIDHEKPTGTCFLSLFDNSGKITVSAKDNNQIKGYEYLYGDNKTELINDTTYTINTLDEKASITIYDTANNYNTITCNTIDNSTKNDRQYTLKTYNYNGENKKYWFYEPNISVREKVPLVIYFHGDHGNGSTSAVNDIAIPKNIKDGQDFPYYVVAPYVGTKEDFVLELIDYLIKNYNIDTKRIVISGGSAGSRAALRIASHNQNKFSCIVIIAAFKGTLEVSTDGLNTFPIWFFQGSGDNYKGVSDYVNKINSNGGNAQLTQYKGSHDAPANAFLRTDLTNWILENKAQQGF